METEVYLKYTAIVYVCKKSIFSGMGYIMLLLYRSYL